MCDASPNQLEELVVYAKNHNAATARDAFSELNNIPLNDILDQDSHPTFVLDLDSDYLDYGRPKDDLEPIFCNAALRLHESLLDRVTGVTRDNLPNESGTATYEGFRSWATSSSKFDDSRDVFPLTCLYQGILWTGSTVRRRFRMISGSRIYDRGQLPKGDLGSPNSNNAGSSGQNTPKKSEDGEQEDPLAAAGSALPIRPAPRKTAFTPPPSSICGTSATFVTSTKSRPTNFKSSKNSTSDGKTNDTSGSSNSIVLSSPEHAVSDWTARSPSGIISEHVKFARAVDWAATPLGPMTKWSVEFRAVANLVMRNPHPAALFWGEELTMLYNEAYSKEVAGNKHPDLMGTGFSGPFSELWETVSPVFRECARTGKSVRRDNERLPIERFGYLEETFFAWSFTPLYGGSTKILGFYNAPFDTTRATVSTRRLETLRHLGERLSHARSIKHFWKCVLDGLEDNHYDVPFALLYSIADADDADTASQNSDSTISLKSCHLEGSIGIPEGHPAAPPRLDLKRSTEGFIPAFREAMRTREPTMLQTRDGTLPESLLEGIQWRGIGDPCKQAIIVPVRPTNGENICAFLLIGVNPRRAYDEDYQNFSAMLNRQLATSLASFLLFEEEVRQNKNAAEAAALQQEKLSQALQLQTSRMRRMTELSPLGMYLFSPAGVLLEANDRYYEMTEHPRDDEEPFLFMSYIAEGSKEAVHKMWDALRTDPRPQFCEIQLDVPNVQPRDLNGEPIEYWVYASSMPEKDGNGELVSIMGSIADISDMKWAQGLQERRLKEAEETKRQQNEFIDITSHEMRNPLSAILICADDIRETLSRHSFSKEDTAVIEECVESANNIALCVQHQKAIVDDILTVSKLDSNLLLITPIPVQPVAVVKRAMSMFKPEVQAKNIDFEFLPHRSLQELNVDWVNLDPSRLLQITVNLITNAIKFTQTSPKRVISVHLGVAKDQPDLQGKGFDYVPMRGSLAAVTSGDEWGDGELLYLRVQVEDTGCGLTPEEKQLLFERFAQASPRTHAYYGGSGLGLFISRQLAELHGGQIGVSSEAGVGSTFGFFIQVRRIAAPPSSQTHSRHSSEDARAEREPPVAVSEPRALAVPLPNLSATTQRSYSYHTSPSPSPSAGPATPPPLLSPPVHPLPPSRPPLHILIVEDNIVNQKVLSRQLQKAGCVVHTADNGVHCLSFLSGSSFQIPEGTPLSLILMDLEMPEMDGLTCVARIRELQKEGRVVGHVPVIAVTANVRGEQIACARDSGMDDVVSKPFRVGELMGRIEGLLARLKDAEVS